jgi:glycosyltransferase involved in cell wall biosynthesis
MVETGCNTRMKVIFFHRKPRPDFNFSVENLFKYVRDHLPSEVSWEVKQLRYFSDGLLKRVYIGLEAAFSQKGINHITGDINFIAIFLRKKKTVLTILDLGLLNNGNWLKRYVLKLFWVKLPVLRSAVVTTISQATKDELLRSVRIDPTRVKVVYVPISQQFIFSPKIFNKERPNILQVGTKPNKNVRRLVRALSGIPCHLEIIGEVDQALLKELNDSALDFSSSKNLTNQEVVEKYQRADIIAFVSTYEGFGMPIVEANATGRVVVTSNVLSMPEIAGDAAHLVDPYDIASIREGFLKVITDDGYRDTLVGNGLSNQKRFDVLEIAKQYTEIYRSLAKS